MPSLVASFTPETGLEYANAALPGDNIKGIISHFKAPLSKLVVARCHESDLYTELYIFPCELV